MHKDTRATGIMLKIYFKKIWHICVIQMIPEADVKERCCQCPRTAEGGPTAMDTHLKVGFRAGSSSL